MEKRKNAFAIMLVIIIILLCILIGLYVFDRFFKEDNIAITENSLNSTNIDTLQSDNNLSENNVIESKIETKEVIVEKGVFMPINPDKLINNAIDTKGEKLPIIKIDKYDHEVDSTLSLDFDGNVTIKYGGDSPCFGSDINLELNKEYQITGFSGTVVDTFMDELGTGVEYPVVIFLMDDGTVEYIDLVYAFKYVDLKSCGKIEGLDNIVRLERVGLGDPYYRYGDAVIAVRNDGVSILIDRAKIKDESIIYDY